MIIFEFKVIENHGGVLGLTSGTSGTVNVGRPLAKFPKPASEPHAASENSSFSSAARRWALRSWPVGLVVENLSTKLFIMREVLLLKEVRDLDVVWKLTRLALLRVRFCLARCLVDNSGMMLCYVRYLTRSRRFFSRQAMAAYWWVTTWNHSFESHSFELFIHNQQLGVNLLEIPKEGVT